MHSRRLIIISLIGIILALAIAFRIYYYKSSFDKTVRESLKTTEGYDQKLVNMVKHLENELTKRASFGYVGGKDPMTGRRRRVVKPIVQKKQAHPKEGEKKVVEAPDPVKLTAIIFDDKAKRYTAIIMDGERSFSVGVGDVVKNRRITKIADDAVFMQDNLRNYKYDISGKRMRKYRIDRTKRNLEEKFEIFKDL